MRTLILLASLLFTAHSFAQTVTFDGLAGTYSILNLGFDSATHFYPVNDDRIHGFVSTSNGCFLNHLDRSTASQVSWLMEGMQDISPEDLDIGASAIQVTILLGKPVAFVYGGCNGVSGDDGHALVHAGHANFGTSLSLTWKSYAYAPPRFGTTSYSTTAIVAPLKRQVWWYSSGNQWNEETQWYAATYALRLVINESSDITVGTKLFGIDSNCPYAGIDAIKVSTPFELYNLVDNQTGVSGASTEIQLRAFVEYKDGGTYFGPDNIYWHRNFGTF
jgi:hypothetical protein